jgi:peptidyl-prolyl cis-trans isomerase SurA
MTEQTARLRRAAVAAASVLAMLAVAADALAQARPTATDRAASRAADRSASRPGDYIVAIVNQELVTAVEVDLRMKRVRDEAARTGQRLPADEELRRQVLDALIEERVILTFSRDSGGKVDELELDRAVQSVAAQNQINVEQLRERLKADGIDYPRFRANLADQMMVERTREREVYQRIRVTDADVDRVLEAQRSAANADAVVNLAQILVTVPEGAAEAVVAERRARADSALARVKAGEAFETVARELSEDNNRQRGGELGPRPQSRLPDLFVEATRALKAGDVAPALVRSGAGFHVLKVLARDDANAPRVTQIRARHILLRPSAQLTGEQAAARLAAMRTQIESGRAKFEDLARQFSEDGSAAQGGDLGWAAPGVMVPEFEEAMARLPNGGLSAPVASRFGVHLIQVLDRRQVEVDPKQLREQARNTLREQKFDEAYAEWARDLRGRAYIEMREPPL